MCFPLKSLPSNFLKISKISQE